MNIFLFSMDERETGDEASDEPERLQFVRRSAFAWLARNIQSHGAAGDLAQHLEFWEIVRAVQHRIGIPLQYQAWFSELEKLLGDNENVNSGHKAGLATRGTNYKRRELQLRQRYRLARRGVRFKPFQLIGCNLHILNLCDVMCSTLWRAFDLAHGDPNLPDDDNSIRIGGYDTKEGVIQFFSRFFSRTFRNHTAFRGFLVKHYADTEEIPRALRSRFWKRLAVACYLYDRLDQLFGVNGFWDTFKDLEEQKESAAYVLLAHMRRHLDLVRDYAACCRVLRDWIHSEVGHSAAMRTGTGNAKRHLKLLKDKIADAKKMCAQTAAGDALIDALYCDYIATAHAQRAQKTKKMRAKLARRRERAQARGDSGADAETMPGLDFGEDVEDLELEDLKKHYHDKLAQVGASGFIRARLREGIQAFVTKFEEFSKPELSASDDDIKEWLFDTFDIERATALLKILHDRTTLTSTSTYREMVRLRSMVSAFSHTPSGAAYGYTHLPPVMLDCPRLLRVHITWVRNVDDMEDTYDEYRIKQADALEADAARRSTFVANKARDEAARVSRVRCCEGGYVHTDRDGASKRCPQDWANAGGWDRVGVLVEKLFTERGGTEDDDDGAEAMELDGCPEYELEYSAIAAAFEDGEDATVVELVDMLQDAFEKQSLFVDTSKYDIVTYDDWFADFVDDDQAETTIDPAAFLASLPQRRYRPRPCKICKDKGRPCHSELHPADQRLRIWMLAGLALKHTIKWPKPTVLDWISKYDLLAPQRSKEEFTVMCESGVWGTDPVLWPKQHRALVAARPSGAPTFSNLSEAEAQALLRCMLTAQERYHERYPTATDWDDWGERLAAVGIIPESVGSASAGVGGAVAIDLSTLAEEPTFAQLA